MDELITDNKSIFTLDQTKKEWTQGLYLGAIVTFVIMYVWLRVL